MRHEQAHPEPEETCFGCKCLGQGVQTLQIKHGADPVQTVPVVSDSGQIAGEHKVHWDGRQDAVIRPGG